MNAKIVVFCTSKGGAGKTTLAVHTAAMLPGRVLLVDADPQASARKWLAAGTAAAAAVRGCDDARLLHELLEETIRQYDWLVVDTPPSAMARSLTIRSGLLVADLAVVPVVPSPLDIWEAMSIAQLLDEVGQVRMRTGVEPLLSRLVVSRQRPRTSFGKEVRDALQGVGVPVFTTTVGEREIYRRAALEGTVVPQLRGSVPKAAIQEMRSLVDEIISTIRQ